MAPLPPRGDWRTVQRYAAGDLVGWLGLVQGQPLEQLRTSDITEAEFIPADQFLQLWEKQPDLRQWCAQQMPAIEVVDLMIRLAQAHPTRARQLEEWRNALSLHAIAREASGHDDGDPQEVGGGQWHWPDGTVWPARPSKEGLQKRQYTQIIKH